jgi:hypothetical protein
MQHECNTYATAEGESVRTRALAKLWGVAFIIIFIQRVCSMTWGRNGQIEGGPTA